MPHESANMSLSSSATIDDSSSSSLQTELLSNNSIIKCEKLNLTSGSPSMEQIDQFQQVGYFAFHNRIFSSETIDALNHRLELVLRGEYNTGCKPDKAPKLLKTPIMVATNNDTAASNNATTNSKNALGYSGNKRNKVFQIINIHKSDRLFHELVTYPLLGKLVAKFMKWEHGARLAQDQIWAK
jgi:hypothetical protein